MIRDAFYAQTLEHFLEVSEPYKKSVYAWEVQNEPCWNTSGNVFVPRSIAGGKTVTPSTMSAFLQRGIDIIGQHGFASTVGHRHRRDLAKFPTGSCRQFHFYPTRVLGIIVRDKFVPEFSETQAFVGEFGALGKDSRGNYPHGAPWHELNGADEGDTQSRVQSRLELLRHKGYPLALVWPDGPESAVAGPDPIKLTTGARRAVATFCKT